MKQITTIKGHFAVRNMHFALLVSRFNSFVVDRLVEGALETLEGHGAQASDIDIIKVPGAFEMPLVARRLAAKKKYDAVIALGAVIRGSTPHFEYVAGSCVKGLLSSSLEGNIPIAFGVLTVDTIEQAIERAGTKAGNKGGDAALTAIEMINLLRQLES